MQFCTTSLVSEDAMSLTKFRHIVENHPVTTHPFLEAFRTGALSVDDVKYWLSQQYRFSIQLANCFAALYAKIPHEWWGRKAALVNLITVEAWKPTNDSQECHSSHFSELCDFLCFDPSSVPEASYTKRFLKHRLSLCLSYPVTHGIASIALGNELLNMSIFRAYRDGIHKIPGLEGCPTGYFDTHLRDEEADFAIFDELYGLVDDGTEEIERTLTKLLDHRSRYFDQLFADLKKD
jgi:hypothetical protein